MCANVSYYKSRLGNFGGFRAGHSKQNKPTAPNKMIRSKSSQLMSPHKSNLNPPTLPFHHHSEVSGGELAIRATKNDKIEMESRPMPIWRRLKFINVLPSSQRSKADHG
jgi:hypothetical protein